MEKWTGGQVEPLSRACLAHLPVGDSLWQGEGKSCASASKTDTILTPAPEERSNRKARLVKINLVLLYT
jgi:hypothetical protein